MGKLKPLRKAKIVATNKSDHHPHDKESRHQKDKQNLKIKKNSLTSNSSSSSSSSSSSFTKNTKDIDENDDEEWERLEREQNNNDDSNSDDDDDDEDEDGNSNDIQMEGDILSQRLQQDETTYDFEFNDIQEDYIESITVLMKTLFPNPSIAYTISQQVAQQLVGTAITCDGGDDVFAFASVIPLSAIKVEDPLGTLLTHFRSTLYDNVMNKSKTSSSNKSSDSKSVNQIPSLSSSSSSQFYDFLSELSDHHHHHHTSSSSNTTVGKNILTTTKTTTTTATASTAATVGLLLHRKFSNLPLPLIGPLHQNIIDDISWLAGDDDHNGSHSSSSNNNNSSSSSSYNGNHSSTSSIRSTVSNTQHANMNTTSSSTTTGAALVPVKYTHLLIMAPCSITSKFKSIFRESCNTHHHHHHSTSNTKSKTMNTTDDVFEISTENYSSVKEEIVFDLFEDEIFFQSRINQIAYLYHNSSMNTNSSSSKYMMFSLLPVIDYPKCVKEINALVN